MTATGVQGIPQEWFDFRYFWPGEKEVGNYTCGLAREAAATILRQGKPGMLCSDEWFIALNESRNNPCVIGFLVEQACLSHISQTGFHHGDLHWNTFPATVFYGDMIRQIPYDWEGEKLFIPGVYYFRNIDALYLKVDDTKKTALVVPIQITVSNKHKDSETSFFSEWHRWEKRFMGYQLSSTFVWVVRDGQPSSWRKVDAEFRDTRNGTKQVSPKHMQAHITISDLYPRLGLVLSSIQLG